MGWSSINQYQLWLGVNRRYPKLGNTYCCHGENTDLRWWENPKALCKNMASGCVKFFSFTKLTTSQIQSSDRFSRKIRPCTKVVFKWWVLNSSAIGCTHIYTCLITIRNVRCFLQSSKFDNHQPRVTESRQFNHHLNWYVKKGKYQFNWVCCFNHLKSSTQSIQQRYVLSQSFRLQLKISNHLGYLV